MKNFRLLRADEIECRVSRCTEKGVALLLYKTARTDADLLDETYGAENWENDFKLIDGVLYGGIGIDYNGDGRLVWKWDAGTESNTEAEKGRASDAFKRAGFKHGIGRELYSAPFIWIKAADCKKLDQKNGKWVCNDTFTVAKIEYDSQERISGLVIRSGRDAVFDWGYTSETQESGEKQPEMPSWAKGEIFCEACGKPIIGHTAKDGTFTTADEIARRSKAATGKQLCVKCGREAMK